MGLKYSEDLNMIGNGKQVCFYSIDQCTSVTEISVYSIKDLTHARFYWI